MPKAWRVSLSRPFPIYKQLPSDNSCGPQVILMVADYFEIERGRKLFAWEWSRILEMTMRNDLTRDEGTTRRDLVRALRKAGLQSRKFISSGTDEDRDVLCSVLQEDRPVIVACQIPFKGKPAMHYAVLVAMDDMNLHFADPFPHQDTPKGGLRAIRWEEFKIGRWAKGLTVWGEDRWAINLSSV